MKKVILIISISLRTAIDLLSATPNWTVNPSDFSNSMSIVGVIKVDRIETTNENNMIAAYINGEIRGVANLQYETIAERYIAYLIVYGNESSGSVTFKIYDADNDIILDAVNATSFVINGLSGNVGTPYIWTNVSLNTEAELLTFSLPGAIGSSIIGNDAIEVPMETNANLTSLAATFTVSVGASVYVNNILQVSGQTSNSFSNIVIYKVVSENGEIERTYEVTTTTENNSTTDIRLDVSNIDENNVINEVIGSLSTDDQLTYEYTFVEGSGDSDNDSFTISGNQILANYAFDYENQKNYSIRVRATEGANQVFENAIQITVNDLNENPTDIALSNSRIDENIDQQRIIGFLSAMDPDANDTHTFSLPDGSDDNHLFKLDNNILQASTSFDFESNQSFTISIDVLDKDGLTFSKTMTIDVLDRNEAPVVIKPIGSINKESSENIEISTTDVFSDADAGDALTLSIEVPDQTTLPKGVSFDTAQNLIRINSSVSLNSFELHLIATDRGGLSTTHIISVNVNFITSVSAALDELTVYPNPSKYFLHVSMDNPSKISFNSYRIIDLSGKPQTPPNEYHNSIDVSMLRSGTYLLELIEDEQKKYIRFVKE